MVLPVQAQPLPPAQAAGIRPVRRLRRSPATCPPRRPAASPGSDRRAPGGSSRATPSGPDRWSSGPRSGSASSTRQAIPSPSRRTLASTARSRPRARVEACHRRANGLLAFQAGRRQQHQFTPGDDPAAGASTARRCAARGRPIRAPAASGDRADVATARRLHVRPQARIRRRRAHRAARVACAPAHRALAAERHPQLRAVADDRGRCPPRPRLRRRRCPAGSSPVPARSDSGRPVDDSGSYRRSARGACTPPATTVRRGAVSGCTGATGRRISRRSPWRPGLQQAQVRRRRAVRPSAGPNGRRGRSRTGPGADPSRRPASACARPRCGPRLRDCRRPAPAGRRACGGRSRLSIASSLPSANVRGSDACGSGAPCPGRSSRRSRRRAAKLSSGRCVWL